MICRELVRHRAVSSVSVIILITCHKILCTLHKLITEHIVGSVCLQLIADIKSLLRWPNTDMRRKKAAQDP